MDRATEIQRRLGRLRWPVRGRLGRNGPGDESSRHLGPGLEYAGTREYVPGDDPRLIDWNLSARSTHTHIRQANPDRGLEAWIILDRSRSLHWGTALHLKQEAADEIVTAAAALLARRGNRVGAIVFDGGIRAVLRPQLGRRARVQVMTRLTSGLTGEAEPGTALAPALILAERLLTRPALVLVVSDFMVAEGWQAPLRVLGRRHEVVAAIVTDPRESDLPDIGIVTFEDVETGTQLEVDTASGRLRQRFREAALARDATVRAEIRAARAAVMEVSTGEDAITQLVRFFDASSSIARRRPVQVRTS